MLLPEQIAALESLRQVCRDRKPPTPKYFYVAMDGEIFIEFNLDPRQMKRIEKLYAECNQGEFNRVLWVEGIRPILAVGRQDAEELSEALLDKVRNPGRLAEFWKRALGD